MDHVRSCIDFIKLNIFRSSDANKNASSTCDACFEKGRGDSCHSCELCLICALCRTNTHVCVSCILHDRCNVREVQVNKAGNVNKFRNGLNTATKNIVCNFKCVSKCNMCIFNLLKSFVRNNDKGVNMLGKLSYTALSLSISSLTFKSKRLSYNTNSEYSHLFCSFSNNRSGTSTCSTAHTSCNEYHISALKSFLNSLNRFFSTTFSNVGISTCALTASNLVTNNKLFRSTRSIKCHAICVYGNKFNASDICRNHTVNCVISAATYANNFYFNTTVVYLFEIEFHF